MKKSSIVLIIFVIGLLLASAPEYSADASPSVTINVPNLPPDGTLELAVGESYTFDIEITSDEPFVVALAMTDAYYPGQGVFWHGSDREVQGTSAFLQLTMKGKVSTADLPAVCDWPEPGNCWPEGTNPVSIVTGVRFAGGIAVSERFPFVVVVP